MDPISANTFGRRKLAILASAGLLTRCASVPSIAGLTASDVGMPSGRAPPPVAETDDVDALQQQYDLQAALSAAPMVFGNRVSLLASGSDAFQAIFKAIAEAKDSINLEYFILADVRSGGTRLSDLLLERLRSGVKVNIIYDSYGSRDTPGAFFETLRNAGAKTIEFNPINPLTRTTGRSRWLTGVSPSRAALTWTPRMRTRHRLASPPMVTQERPTGATRRSVWRGRPLRNCRSCFSAPGESNTDQRWRRRTIFHRCRARACRPSASSAVRPAIRSLCITPRC